MRLIFILFSISFSPVPVFSQSAFIKPANEAFMITRMISKFHVQPREVNEEFSEDVFSKVLQQLDRQKVLFTLEDITALSVYKRQLHNQIKSKQTKIFGDVGRKGYLAYSNTPYKMYEV